MVTGKNDILDKLRQRRDEMTHRFGVTSLAIFGSVSRGDDTESSDVDVLVEFNGPATFDGFFGLKAFLEEVLGRTVDLVTRSAIREELRSHIERDLVHVS